MHIFEKSKSVQNKIVLGAIKRKKMLLDREINEAKHLLKLVIHSSVFFLGFPI